MDTVIIGQDDCHTKGTHCELYPADSREPVSSAFMNFNVLKIASKRVLVGPDEPRIRTSFDQLHVPCIDGGYEIQLNDDCPDVLRKEGWNLHFAFDDGETAIASIRVVTDRKRVRSHPIILAVSAQPCPPRKRRLTREEDIAVRLDAAMADPLDEEHRIWLRRRVMPHFAAADVGEDEVWNVLQSAARAPASLDPWKAPSVADKVLPEVSQLPEIHFGSDPDVEAYLADQVLYPAVSDSDLVNWPEPWALP
eukprot:TRINITY_DN4069_c0_g2_i1.p1 TRINITY_DN4069_c0_g2~~TRINITY_DN4069_c0_g2_i1.p1  ORF type:complete len:251 (-),score=27.90 TRINITY_DN4069_c0_g2_i1:40-792(-)